MEKLDFKGPQCETYNQGRRNGGGRLCCATKFFMACFINEHSDTKTHFSPMSLMQTPTAILRLAILLVSLLAIIALRRAC